MPLLWCIVYGPQVNTVTRLRSVRAALQGCAVSMLTCCQNATCFYQLLAKKKKKFSEIKVSDMASSNSC